MRIRRKQESNTDEQCQVPEGYGVPTGNDGGHYDSSTEVVSEDIEEDGSEKTIPPDEWRENGAL